LIGIIAKIEIIQTCILPPDFPGMGQFVTKEAWKA
jgi:hypothetical protein